MEKIKESFPEYQQIIGVTVGTLLYPIFSYVVQFIPNPMVLGANIALNMIFPVLTGYFYGKRSGAVAGALGTAIAALLWNSLWDALAILPHALMGFTAGYIYSKTHSDLGSSLSIIVGHLFNMIFYILFGLVVIATSDIGITVLGLITETMIDIIAIMLFISVLKKWLLQKTADSRW